MGRSDFRLPMIFLTKGAWTGPCLFLEELSEDSNHLFHSILKRFPSEWLLSVPFYPLLEEHSY